MFKHIKEYADFSAKINNYLSAIMIDNKISCEEYNYSHIWELVKAQGVSIRGFDFEEVAGECISGLLIQDELETTIGFNQNLDDKAKNFVISHEIIHYLFHKKDTTIFIDTQKELQHFGYKELQEFEANIGASVILLPDKVLVHYLKKGWNFKQISDFFGLTEYALSVRFIQMLQADLGLSFKVAKYYVDDISYSFNTKGKQEALLLTAELESQQKKNNLVQAF